MQSTLILHNTGSAKKADLHLILSYFIIESGQEKITSQEFFLTLKSESLKQAIDFGASIIEDKDVNILIKKLDGNIVTQKVLSLKRMVGQEVPIELSLNDEIVLNPPSEPTELSKPNFVYGRLLDKNGTHKMEDAQVILFVKVLGEELKPLTAIRTEAKGYFSFDYPEGIFTEAYAQVGLDLKENPLPIKLEEKGNEEIGSRLVFPKRIVLVAEMAESEGDGENKGEDCGCNSLNFDEKRVLEEFSYFTLVRTSEPEIKGYILEDEDELTLGEILRSLPYSVFELVEPIKKLSIVTQKSPVSFAAGPALNAGDLTTNRAVATPEDDFQTALKTIKVRKGVLNNFLKEEKTITRNNIGKLFERNEAANFRKVLIPQITKPKPLGRVELNTKNTIDWDDEPTIYQAVEVAHGHLLQFKTEWIADGFSLGDLLYSLPLAPGQKKQIVVFDWERREAGSNTQSIDFEEGLSNTLTRDRDIFEVAKGTINERSKGSSKTTTASAQCGFVRFVFRSVRGSGLF